MPMHTLIDARTHGYLDYAVVAVFALAPAVLGLTGLAATLSYALAAIHLAMTLTTAFPLGVASLVPFRVHGMVEVVVGAVLVALGVFAFEGAAWVFFLVMGLGILAVWAATNYEGTTVAAR